MIRGWLEGLDLSGFDPNFMPPMTATKRHMQESNMHPLEAWCEALWHDMDVELLGNKRSFYTAQELCILYHGAAWAEMENSGKVSTEKHLLVHLAKRHRRVGKHAIRANNQRGRYWGIRKNGAEATAADVKADVKRYPSLTTE